LWLPGVSSDLDGQGDSLRGVVVVSSQCTGNLTVVANVNDVIRFQLPGDCTITNDVYVDYPDANLLSDAGPLSLPTARTNATVDDFGFPPFWSVFPNVLNTFVFDSQLTASFLQSGDPLRPGDTIGTLFGPVSNFRVIYGGPPFAPALAPARFALNFDANGGTCTRDSSGLVNEGTWITVPRADECSRSGYELVGFNVKKDGSSPLGFDPGGYTVMTSDNTIYAIWRSLETESTPAAVEPAYPVITVTGQREQALLVIRGTSSVAKAAEVELFCWTKAGSRPTSCGKTSTRPDGTFMWAGTQPQRGWVMAVIESTMSNSIRLRQARQR
jgi:hypothetical protein